MGIFDFLKRKPKPPGESKSNGPSPHYAFAHYALRHIALSGPLQFLAVTASPESDQFFNSVLDDVAKQCGRKASFDASSISIHPTRVNNFPCVIVELPEPAEMAEAHMVALVALIDISSEQLPDMDKVPARYFTLEKGFSLSNEPRTVLAEWDHESHANFGDGPEATAEAFAATLAKHVG